VHFDLYCGAVWRKCECIRSIRSPHTCRRRSGPRRASRGRSATAETVSQAYTALSPEPVDSNPFHGQIKLFELPDNASISSIKAGAQVVRRTRQDIKLRTCEAVFVNFQLAGQSAISQRGIEAKLDAGSLVLLDATEPFAMKFNRDFEQVCLHLPKSVLEENGIRVSDFIGRAVTRQSGFSAPLFSAIDSPPAACRRSTCCRG
jgi:hypothetical protein